MYSTDVLVRYSRDRDAATEAAHWHDEARRAGVWRRRRRQAAQRSAETAERRAVQAGIDWQRLPRPTPGLRPPDRSRRRRLGRRVPPAGSPVPFSLRGLMLRRSRPPRAPVPAAAPTAPAGGGVGAMAGQTIVTEVSAAAAGDWLGTQPAAAYTGADSSAWFEASDGSFWHRDAQGSHFALAADGQTLLPLSGEGLLYELDGTTWRTSLADGTPLRLRDDGQLVSDQADGTQHVLADDGLFYLVTPAALYPIAADGEVLLEAGIDAEGIPLDTEMGGGGGDLFAIDDGGGGLLA